jgi:hypothetical protein
MPDFRLPLSGDVTQTIAPLTLMLNPIASQIGLMNINLGTSSDSAIESQVLSDVASYGKQLGRIEDVLIVLLKHFRPTGELTGEEKEAIRHLETMVNGIADVKERQGVKAPLRP